MDGYYADRVLEVILQICNWICSLALPQLTVALRLQNVAKVTNLEVVKIEFHHLS